MTYINLNVKNQRDDLFKDIRGKKQKYEGKSIRIKPDHPFKTTNEGKTVWNDIFILLNIRNFLRRVQ